MAGEDLFGQNVENPFANLGLNKEAVRALSDINEPEVIRTAINGLVRTFSRAMHPDTGREGTQRSTEYFNDFLQAARVLDSCDDRALSTYAKAYTGAKRIAKNPTSHNLAPRIQDHAPQLIRQLAMASFGEIGLSFPATSRIFLDNYGERHTENFWASLRRSDVDTAELTSYKQKERSSSHRSNTPDHNSSDHLIEEIIPWTKVLGYQFRPNRIFPVDATIEVINDETAILRDDLGVPVEADLQILLSEREMDEPGIYHIFATFKNVSGEITLDKANLGQSFYTPVSEPREMELRILGSADKQFRNDFNLRLARFVGKESAALRGTGDFGPQKRLFTNQNSLGYKLPLNSYDLLGRYFTPIILENNLLITASAGDTYIAGHIKEILK